MGIRMGADIVAVVPPRAAWGNSPPWPFDDDAVYLYRAALAQFGRPLVIKYLLSRPEQVAEAARMRLPVSDQFRAAYPRWDMQFTHLFLAGLVVIYLEDCVSAAEAEAYVLVERRVHGMGMLPGVVSVLRRYLSEHEAGRFAELADFLPLFPKQLRVAKRFVSL
jgi:hypothetical protein